MNARWHFGAWPPPGHGCQGLLLDEQGEPVHPLEQCFGVAVKRIKIEGSFMPGPYQYCQRHAERCLNAVARRPWERAEVEEIAPPPFPTGSE